MSAQQKSVVAERLLLNSSLCTVLILSLALFAGVAHAEVHLVVGTPVQGGQYATVQAAVDAVPDSNTERYVVDIMPGTYMERVIVPSNKPFVTLRGLGLDASDTVLTFNETANTPPNESTVHASTVVLGTDFVAENLTFENSYGPGVQALAIYAKADRAIFDNVRFLGWQDTLRSENGRHYFHNVYVEGSVDFIYGRGTAFFEDSLIYAKTSGYVTAQARESAAETNGYVFKDSTITGSAPANSVYLGRPWQPYARAVYLDTRMSPIIRPEGWSVWGGTNNHLTSYFAEYNSMDVNGMPLDVSQRVSWSHQLSAVEADAFSKENWLTGWNPALSALPTLSADFNSDESVNGLDFLIWQSNFGLSGQTDNSNGDASGDGVIDRVDLTLWSMQYGVNLPSQLAAFAVPEPTSILQLAVGAFLVCRRYFWRKRN